MNTAYFEVLKINEAVARAKENGMPISEYTLRRAIRSGQLPCRIVGRTYLITWTNLVNWVSCADGCDNAVPDSKSKIRKICSRQVCQKTHFPL